MKLRVKGNLLTFRVTPHELTRFYETRRLERTLYFSTDGISKLVYVLAHDQSSDCAMLRYESPEIQIILPTRDIKNWIESDRAHIFRKISLGPQGTLRLLIETDTDSLDQTGITPC